MQTAKKLLTSKPRLSALLKQRRVEEPEEIASSSNVHIVPEGRSLIVKVWSRDGFQYASDGKGSRPQPRGA